jgi:hypothetical protein
VRARLSHVALFLALTGTAAAAPLVTGAMVENGTLTGRDVKRGSLGRGDLAVGVRLPRGPRGLPGDPGPPGPQGPDAPDGPSARVQYLRVNADGTPADPYNRRITVAHAGTGVYCLTSDPAGWVDVVSTNFDEAQRAAVVVYANGAAAAEPCAPGTTAQVTIDSPASAGLDDGPFVFVARDDDDPG